MHTQKLAMLGLGGRTTLFYLRQINELYHKRNGGDAVCPLVLKKTDFEQINSLLPDQSSQLEEIINGHLQRLDGVGKILVPNITLHETIDRMALENNQQYPILHPVKLAVEQLKKKGSDKIMLVGSQYSMTSDYLKQYFLDADIDVVVPSADDQQALDQCRKNVYSFTESKKDILSYLALLENYKQDCDIVIACTELSLILSSVDERVYDMASLQIEAAMNLYETQ